MEQFPFFIMIGVVLTAEQIPDFKKVIESLTTGSTDNYVISYGKTPKDAYSQVQREIERFVSPPNMAVWN